MHVAWPPQTATVLAVCLLAAAAGCDGEPSSAPSHEPPPAATAAVTEIAFGPSDQTVTMFAADGKPADLRSKAGMGVSGAGDDFAFDNTSASAMGGQGGVAKGRPRLPEEQVRFTSFTIQTWFRTPPDRPIGRGAVLVSHRGGNRGFELYARTDGTLTLWFGDGTTGRQVISPQVYTESGQWVFVAVTFSAARKADPERGVEGGPGRVTFYKGTARTAVREVDRAEAPDWPPVSAAGLGPFTIGARADGSRAFQGRLDNIRIRHASDGTPPTNTPVRNLPAARAALRPADPYRAGVADLVDLERFRRTDLGKAAISPP